LFNCRNCKQNSQPQLLTDAMTAISVLPTESEMHCGSERTLEKRFDESGEQT